MYKRRWANTLTRDDYVALAVCFGFESLDGFIEFVEQQQFNHEVRQLVDAGYRQIDARRALR